MSGDVQVRFCERLGVRFPRATLPLYLVGRAHQHAGQGVEALRIYGQLPDGFPESVWTSAALLRRPPARYLQRITRVTTNH